ncbi:hypothetical protein Ancab_013214 [Ancistrocladus abbreviatus]
MAQSILVAESKAVDLVKNEKNQYLSGLTNINGNITTTTTEKKNRIQVSNTKKPLFFYLNLAKRYIKQHNDVELSALGMAIPTVVTIAEILKANGLAVEKKVLTSTVGSKDENKGRLVQKAKLEILLEKSDNPKSDNPKNRSETQAESKPTVEAESKKAVDAEKEE